MDQTAERTVRTGVFPVGVETAQLNRLARREAQAPFVRDVVESLADRVMIIGVDRLDYSKGIALRMEAFDRFLSNHSDWRGKVTYLQITPRSRSEIQEYADMERQIDETAGRINGTRHVSALRRHFSSISNHSPASGDQTRGYEPTCQYIRGQELWSVALPIRRRADFRPRTCPIFDQRQCRKRPSVPR
ncbi:MAG TPA: trehalose-6-phosphate synthase [Xanthobacteraceae bacterium]|nr:trehalose-6-phosphate synthase [Xanthobacteraceae bacterium]